MLFDHEQNFCNTSPMKSFLKKHVVPITATLAFLLTLGVGIEIGKHLESTKNQVTNSGNLDLQPFWKTLNVLNERFVPTTATSSVPTDEKKVFGAIQGLAASYGDPYTVFFPPKESGQFADEVRGEFGGVGIEIGIKDNTLVVIAPLKNTPAERAGIKAGELILKIDKQYTDGMSVDDAIDLIRGEKGTPVVLTMKNGAKDPHEVKLVRDTISIPTIDTKLRDDGVFVISLYNFSANSASLFRDALRAFINSGTDKLVIDLRNNPGGYLEAAQDMASFFLPLGKTIVIEDTGVNTKQESLKSKGYDVFNQNLKLAVLINGGSASASEILAGALKDNGVAKLVGEKSFGKGSVQELIPITADTSLKVTIARWLTPKGVSISLDGITPDVVTEITEKDIRNKHDAQLEKAAEILKDPNFKR